MHSEITVDRQSIFFRCVEDSNEAIMISDQKGVLVYVNPAWSKIYGYSNVEAIGETPRLLHSGMHDDSFYRSMWTDIRDPKIGHWKGELINKAKNGDLVPVLLTITPYKSEAGEVKGYMGIAVDLSYKREMEAKVAHQDRLASIGLLASGLAHEIGTPLGVVRGRAEFLMMQASDPSVKKNLEIITSQIDRISKLIRSLLRVSRSFTDINIGDVSVHSVASEVMALLGQNLREDTARVNINVDDDIKVRADYGRLEQVILNLVMNSIYAIKRAIQSGRSTDHFLNISAKKRADGLIVISVQDSGCGISPENLKKLFKPFFTTKDVGEGTGLGLAIVAQLVREMDGEITVSSELDIGTTFDIVLESAQG